MRAALRLFAVLLWTLLAAPLVAPFASAQTPTPAPELTAAQRLDNARATLDRVESSLQRNDLSDAALQDLRAEVEPVAASVDEALQEIEPRLAAAKSRLDQFGVKPPDAKPADPKAPEATTPESVAANAERAEQQKAVDEADALLKRARALALRAEQTTAAIVNKRRALFRQAVFQRSFSVINPRLWYHALAEAPRDTAAVATLSGDWVSSVVSRLAGRTLFGALAAFSAVIIAFLLVRALARRVLARRPMMGEPNRLRKAAAALWVAFIVASTPIIAAIALIEIARFYELFNFRLEPIVNAVFDAVRRIAIAAGLARGLLVIDKPEWRLLDLSTETAAKLQRMVILVACIVSAMKVVDAVNDVIAASVNVSVLLRGVGSVSVAAVMAFTLYGMGSDSTAEDDALGPLVEPKRDWYALLRFAAWGAIIVVTGAAAIGYVALASFVVDQIVWVAFVGALGFLLYAVADEGFGALLEPGGAAGRAAMNSIGLRRERLRQIAMLLRGATAVVLGILCVMLVLAPWGVESDDMIGNLRAAFFGFKVGDVTISLSTVFIALALAGLGVTLTRIVQGWLEQQYLPLTQLDVGLQNSIRTSVGYIGVLIAISIGLAHVGVSFEKLAIVAGALSIGVGFGLQSIVSNFVSGLILLWERAIRVGDWVVVGDEQGHVRRINVRSTEIETFDRATMIVPNSNLVTGIVKNWVRTDRVGRLRVPVTVTMTADPDQVRDNLIACAEGQEGILQFPKPQVMFMAMSDNTLKFELICFIGDVERSQRVRSDLNFTIFKRFRDAHIDLSPPPAAPVVVKIGN